MATLVLTTIGTAVGGPIGGAIGALIGQQVDEAIFRPGGREGLRLKELTVTTSSYGQPIPRNFGRMRVAGTVIWSTELIESKNREGGGKGRPSTTTYSYSASFAVALSSTPLDRIGRIWADGNLLRGASGDLKVEGAMRFYPGTGDHAVDPLIAADRSGPTPAFRDCAYVVFENLQLGDFGNRIPALNFEVFAQEDASVSLGQLVPAAATSAGDLQLQNARGFSDEGGAIGSSLGAIDRVFPIKCITTSRGLEIAPYTTPTAPIRTLPPQLSTRGSDGVEERHKRRGSGLGTEPLALRYYDEERDYQPGVQRALGQRPEGREAMVDLPATMTAQGARQLANSNAHRARWKGEQVVWRVGELDPQVGAGSVVKLPGTNGRWLVKSWEWFDRGIELGLERLAPELGAVSATDSGAANAPDDLEATPTLLEFTELPAEDLVNPNAATLFAAATSEGAGWRGAALFVDRAGSLSSIGSTRTARAVAGHLAEPLAGASSLLLQPAATVEIDLPADDLAFAGTDVIGLAMGANRLLVGGEVLQFMKASANGPRRWALTGLLRGRAGTEDAASIGHPAGEVALLLDDRLTAIDPAQVPPVQGTRLAAIGRGDPDAVFTNLRNIGLSRRPLMPVAPRLRIDVEDTWELCWTRRARGQWLWPEASEVPLVEEGQSYSVGYGPCDMPFAIWSLDTPRLLISSAERAALLSEFGPASLWVRQIGTFGQSPPLFLASIT